MNTKSKSWIRSLSLSIFLALFPIGPALATLITNGSFESPDVNATNTDGGSLYYYLRNTTNPDGWSRTGPRWAWYDSRPGHWAASDGNQFTEVESGQEQRISTSFATVIGVSYLVSFDYAANPVAGSTPDDKINAYINGSLMYYIDGYDGNNSALEWFTQTFQFTATSTSTTLMFADGYTGDSNTGGFLDNVVVIPATSSISEPATITLLIMGMLTVGRFSARGKQRSMR